MKVIPKIVLFSGIGLILWNFFDDRFRNGWYFAAREVTTLPSGETMVLEEIRWGPAEIGCLLVLAYLAFVLAKAVIRLLHERGTRQDRVEYRGPSRGTRAGCLRLEILLWSGMGLFLLTFFLDHLRSGWRTVLRTPMDLGCLFILAYLALALAGAALPYIWGRTRQQDL